MIIKALICRQNCKNMPELPEVEITKRGVAGQITGARVTAVRVGKPLRWPLGCLEADLVGRHIVDVRRRGKYILLDLGGGIDRSPICQPILLLHLGMSGKIVLNAGSADPPGKHDHFDLHTTRGLLRLNDPRRFGAVVYAPCEADPIAQKLLGGLGVEPLTPDFDAERFYLALQQTRVSIKQVLLSGRVVVGVGNIYASEALYLAGIRPTCAANAVSRKRIEKLASAIREVLEAAVRLGGSTLRDFADANGESGHFQLHANVYGRAGEPCRNCKSKIKMLRQGQRSTFFCNVCQKL